MSDEFEVGEDGLPRRISAVERRQRQQAADVTPTAKKPTKPAVTRTSAKGVKKVQETIEAGVAVLTCKLPGGGSITMLDPQEVDFFETLKKQYLKEYAISKPNDLARLSQLLMAELAAHRMTKKMAGQTARYDAKGQFTGYEKVDDEEMASVLKSLPQIQSEIRSLEQHLRLDKKSREGHGQNEVKEYMETLKRAAKQYGVHLSERYTKYDEFRNELSWKLRVLDNADDKDRTYHNITAETVLQYCRDHVAEMDDFDKAFAHDKQSIWVGKI